MKNYLLKITEEEKQTIEWTLSEWAEFTKDSIKWNLFDKNDEAVKEFREEQCKILEALKKVKRARQIKNC